MPFERRRYHSPAPGDAATPLAGGADEDDDSTVMYAGSDDDYDGRELPPLLAAADPAAPGAGGATSPTAAGTSPFASPFTEPEARRRRAHTYFLYTPLHWCNARECNGMCRRKRGYASA